MSAEAVSLAMIYQINTGNNILHRTHLHYGIHTLYYILCICFFPYYIVNEPYENTGLYTYTRKGVMRAKGAVNCHLFGASAWLRMFKFAFVGAYRGKANFFTLLIQSWRGIIYYLIHCRRT